MTASAIRMSCRKDEIRSKAAISYMIETANQLLVARASLCHAIQQRDSGRPASPTRHTLTHEQNIANREATLDEAWRDLFDAHAAFSCHSDGKKLIAYTREAVARAWHLWWDDAEVARIRDLLLAEFDERLAAHNEKKAGPAAG